MLDCPARPARLALGLLALSALLLQGGLFIQKSWLWTGDTIYHRALMAEIMNGELLPGGPYRGLPAFYSPLFHYLAAGLATLFRFDPLDGVKLLSVLAAPCLPLVAYYTVRQLRFDRGVALLGAFFATFGGGLQLTEGRVWVDALFVGQHNFFPLFPRDAAFLLLPLVLVWVYRGLIDDWRPGPILAGVAGGVMILVHTQSAVFAAPILALYLALTLVWRRDLLRRAVRGSVVTTAVALGISSFWWVWELVAIVRSGSFSVQMPAYRVPVKLVWQEAPLDFGVFLLLGMVGIVLTLRLLIRERNPAALLLLVWWAAPTLLAILRPTGFPGGDTFFPRRLWQFASQPLVLMSAYGLLQGIFRPLHWHGRWGLGVVGMVGLLAGVPNSWGTWQRIGEFWNDTSFADVNWDLAGNFRYGLWLQQQARAEGIRTVLVPTPDATMVWYLAGEKVVYLYPTAAIKLAFDVRRLTGYGVDEREADLTAAYSGQPERLAEVARKYEARYVVLRRDGDQVGLVDLPAAALRGGKNSIKMIETNHYQYFGLGEGDAIRFEFFSPVEGSATVSLRARRRSNAPRIAAHLLVNGANFPIAEGEIARDEYREIVRAVPLRAGRNEVRFQTDAALELARFVAYTTPLSALLDRFSTAYADSDTVLLTPR
jgi:hypothetical protein